jgi:Xaa-Pro dipeptidase
MELPSLSQAEFERRWSAAQNAMREQGLDVLLAYGDDHALFGPANVRYLTNFPVHFEPALVIVPVKSQPVLATGPETADHAAIVSRAPAVVAVEEFGVPGEEYPYLTMRSLPDIVSEVAGSAPERVGLTGLDMMSVETWECVRPAVGQAEIVRAEALLLELRKKKSAEEIAVLRHAFNLTQCGMEAALEACRPGVHEFEVAAAAEFAMRSRGAEGTAIDTIVGSGMENSRPIVARAGARKIQAGETISITTAPRYEGYGAPIGRLVHIGEPTKTLRDAAEAAREAQRRAVWALRPGVVCKDVDAAARNYLREMGYERYCAYGIAHSVGVQEFEPPFFGPSNTDRVVSPMVISVDIPMFFGPWGGFRLEDSFLVSEEGTEPLTDIRPGMVKL